MNSIMETYLGLDLGGTKLLVGEVDAQGRVLASKRYSSGYLAQESAADFLLNSLDDYLSTSAFPGGEPKAIGLGTIGRVDSENGIWHQIDADRTTEIHIGEIISRKYSIPCFADNDVKSATKAEMLWGAGKISNNFIFLNIGTGIASGAVIDGKLLKGSSFNAGETGHVGSCVNLGLECCCGRKDCVELLASGSGLDACARFLKDRYSTSLQLPQSPARVEAKEIFRLYSQGDELCTVLTENAAKAAAGLIMDLVRCFDPDTIVLGGGIVSEDLMYSKILENIDKYTVRFVRNGIIRTTLDPAFAGLLGAAANAMNICR